MDSICIEVFIPGTNKNYDIKLVPKMYIKDAADYIFKTISEYEMLSLVGESLILCSRNSKKILNGNMTLAQCGIKDGSRLILV